MYAHMHRHACMCTYTLDHTDPGLSYRNTRPPSSCLSSPKNRLFRSPGIAQASPQDPSPCRLSWQQVIYIYIHVCMYVYICMYVFMYVCMCVCMYICMRVCIYVCMYVCMRVCMYIYIYNHTSTCIRDD